MGRGNLQKHSSKDAGIMETGPMQASARIGANAGCDSKEITRVSISQNPLSVRKSGLIAAGSMIDVGNHMRGSDPLTWNGDPAERSVPAGDRAHKSASMRAARASLDPNA